MVGLIILQVLFLTSLNDLNPTIIVKAYGKAIELLFHFVPLVYHLAIFVERNTTGMTDIGRIRIFVGRGHFYHYSYYISNLIRLTLVYWSPILNDASISTLISDTFIQSNRKNAFVVMRCNANPDWRRIVDLFDIIGSIGKYFYLYKVCPFDDWTFQDYGSMSKCTLYYILVSQFDVSGKFKDPFQDISGQLRIDLNLFGFVSLRFLFGNEGNAACRRFIIDVNVRNFILVTLDIYQFLSFGCF